MQLIYRLLVSKNMYGTEHAEGSQIVNAGHMIIMNMREQHTIQRSKSEGHKLLTDIRTTVNENPRRLRFQQSSRTQTLVMWVSALTYRTMTSQRRDATRRASTQEC